MKYIKQYILPEKMDKKWVFRMLLSLLLPAFVLLTQPVGLSFQQAFIVADVILVITWWSTGLVKKIPASIFLLIGFLLIGGISGKVIFSFPLSETFPMIVVTYLFSQGIANAGMIERLIEPVLIKVVHTPVQCIIAIFVTFYLTMYVIPQPLARLIIVATMYQCFLQKTNLPQRTRIWLD